MTAHPPHAILPLRLACLLALLALRGVHAQEAGTPQPDNGDKASLRLPQVEVVDTRDMNADLVRTEDDPQPYIIFSAREIQESGANSIEDFLLNHLTRSTSLTGQTASQTQSLATSGAVTPNSSINLNGLGANETLILVDGRRMANVSYQAWPAQGGSGQPDLNGIPLSLVDRIEVLPSSSSALYGGSSVGGVINVILKKQFHGGEVNFAFNNTFNGSDPKRSLDLSYGDTFDEGRTQVMVALGHGSGGSLTLGDRRSYAYRIDAIAMGVGEGPFVGYPQPGTTTNITNTSTAPLVLLNGTTLSSWYTYVPHGTGPTTSQAALYAGLAANAGQQDNTFANDTYYYGLKYQLDPTPTRDSAFLTLRQKINEKVSLFAELSHAAETISVPFNPFASLYIPAGTGGNPFTTDVWVNFPVYTPGQSKSGSYTDRMILGSTFQLPNHWSLDVDLTASRNRSTMSFPPDGQADLSAAIGAGLINPFVDTTQFAINATPYLDYQVENVTGTVTELSVRGGGRIGSLPGGDADLHFRLEQRREGSGTDSQVTISPTVGTLLPGAQSGTVYSSQYADVTSGGAEIDVPVFGTRNPLPFAQELTLQLAGSFDRYKALTQTPSIPYPVTPGTPIIEDDVVFTSRNSTLGLRYVPVRDVILRTSTSSAFLPPTAIELLPNTTPSSQPTQVNDPVTGQSPLVTTYGVGNPNLKPQTGRSFDAGIIWEPSQGPLEGLRVNAEYFRIRQPNFITQPSAQLIVSNPQYASRVTRDPTTHQITAVDVSYINAFLYETEGLDYDVRYRFATSVGRFELAARYTQMLHDWRQYDPQQPSVDYAGFPNDGGEPKGKGSLTLRWEDGPWMARWTSRYWSGYTQTGAPNAPNTLLGFWNGYSNSYLGLPFTVAQEMMQGGWHVDSQLYHDVLVGYTLRKEQIPGKLGDLRIQFGIQNVFNKAPPLDVNNFPLGLAFGGDMRMRVYQANARLSF